MCHVTGTLTDANKMNENEACVCMEFTECITSNKTNKKTLCHSQVVVFKEEKKLQGESVLRSPDYNKIFVRPRRRQTNL